MSVTLATLRSEIEDILRYDKFDPNPQGIDVLINDAVTRIAAGILLLDGRMSPALPDLYSSATVATATDAAYKTLGTTYQRNLVMVADENDDIINPPTGGDYNSFQTFLRRARYKDLSESGSIYMCCAKGSNLYYQGIPSTSQDLLAHFYRKPVDMSASSDTPDGIPEPFQLDIIKHFVCRDVYGQHVGEDLQASTGDKNQKKHDYHKNRFYEILFEMTEFIGEQGQPAYFHSDYYEEW